MNITPDFKPRFQASIMGGMPRTLTVDEACTRMLDSYPEFTAVPSLTPSLRRQLEKMPCLVIDTERKVMRLELSGKEKELVEFYEHYMAGDLDYFAISPKYDPPLYCLAELAQKRHIQPSLVHGTFLGPYTLGLQIKAESGRPAIYDAQACDVMVKTLAMKAAWWDREVGKLFPGALPRVEFGEPGLGVFSSAGGSGSWDTVAAAINESFESVKGQRYLHCCDNFDWSLLMQTNCHVLNFDAYRFGNTIALYAQKLKRFLVRGSTIAWGIVPTGDATLLEKETAESLAERLECILQSLIGKGVDHNLLLESSWITPSCATSTMNVPSSDKVFDLTAQVSQIMRGKYFSREN